MREAMRIDELLCLSQKQVDGNREIDALLGL